MERVLIKLSGEGLANKASSLAIDPALVKKMAIQIKAILAQGVEVGVVVGGGNFWRGLSAEKNGIPRNRADYIGMLATLMNALAIQSGFQQEGIKTRVQSAINIDSKVAENYVNEIAISALEKGEVVIFAGGTGRPYFTTDTTATLVASEIGATKILMGKNGVDGIYNSDPKINPQAQKYTQISYDEILNKNLKVIDLTAISMAKSNNINMIVFDIAEEDALLRAIKGDIPHTEVKK